MKSLFENTDSIIFDMDGTLWDAISSYCRVWNICFAKHGIRFSYTYDDVRSHMGSTIDQIFDAIVQHTGIQIDRAAFLKDVEDVENDNMAEWGGMLYDNVRTGIEALSKRYKLFMVSNCSKNGLVNFMKFSGTTEFFTDSVSFGQNRVPKAVNISILVERNHLEHPIYVGDTQSDCDQTHKAGLPFVYAAYGFGQCTGYDMKVDSFIEFFNYFLNIKKED